MLTHVIIMCAHLHLKIKIPPKKSSQNDDKPTWLNFENIQESVSYLCQNSSIGNNIILDPDMLLVCHCVVVAWTL